MGPLNSPNYLNPHQARSHPSPGPTDPVSFLGTHSLNINHQLRHTRYLRNNFHVKDKDQNTNIKKGNWRKEKQFKDQKKKKKNFKKLQSSETIFNSLIPGDKKEMR